MVLIKQLLPSRPTTARNDRLRNRKLVGMVRLLFLRCDLKAEQYCTYNAAMKEKRTLQVDIQGRFSVFYSIT